MYRIISYRIGDKDHIYALLIQSNDSTIALQFYHVCAKEF